MNNFKSTRLRACTLSTTHPNCRSLLDPDTCAQLTNYVKAHKRRALAWFTNHPENNHPGDALPLFVGLTAGGRTSLPDIQRLDFSKPMRYSSFNKRHWGKALKASDVPYVKFYDLRHAHASLLVDLLGQPGALTLKEVQERLGHSSAVMTLDRYAHSGKPDRERRRNALSAAFDTTTDDENVVALKRSKRAQRGK